MTLTQEPYAAVFARRRAHAVQALRLSAWAWGLLLLGMVVQAVTLGSSRAGTGDVPFVVALLVAGVVAELAFVVLAVLALRAAWRGSDSGDRVSTWAWVVGVVDVIVAALVVLGLVGTVLLLVALDRCAATSSCLTF